MSMVLTVMLTKRQDIHKMTSNVIQKQKGFTLLEVLIVLLLISFIAGLVAPSLPKLYDRLKFNLEKKEVLRELQSMGYKAYLKGQGYRFKGQDSENDADTFLQIPAGWSVIAENEIELKANGICLGGNIQIAYGRYKKKYKLDAPYCEVVAIN